VKGPDHTTKLPRGPRAESSADGWPPFVWPAPPYYDFAVGMAQEGEACLIAFSDGRRAVGVLENFLPEHEILKFQPANSRTAETVAFSDLLTLQLLNAVQLEVHTLPDGAGLHAPSDRQPFCVELADRTRLEGETVGHVQAMCGLFLFVPQPTGGVLRWFVPTTAMRESRVGAQIGKLLIDADAASEETISEALERQRQMRAQRLGEYLTSHQVVSQEQLALALSHQKSQPVQKLGETLVELGFLTRSELEAALAAETKNRAAPLGQILVDMGMLDPGLVHSVMAKKLGVPFVNLRAFQPSPEALKRIPASVAQRYQVLPLAEMENALVVAIDDPTNMERMEEVRFAAGAKLMPVMAPALEIRQALEAAYGGEQRPPARADSDLGVEQLALRLSIEAGGDEAIEQQAGRADSTLVKLINKIIVDAVEQKASDIHIESNPDGRNVRVRLRKDGVLVNYLDIPARFRAAVISRLKIMSQLDISERRKPQDRKSVV